MTDAAHTLQYVLTGLAELREQVPTSERPLITDTADALCLLLERLMEPEFVPPAKVTWKTPSEALTGELIAQTDTYVDIFSDGLVFRRYKREQVSGLPRTDYTLRAV